MKCEWCDTEFSPNSPRQKFCSESCKQKNKRKGKIDKSLTDKGLPPTVQASKLPVPPKKEDAPLIPVSRSEQTYGGKPTPGSPEWYIHGTQDDPSKTWDKVCVRCGERFNTSLELMRFCSQECKKEVIVVIADGPHKKYLEWLKR